MRLHATLRLLLTALLTAGIGSTSRLRAAEDGKPLRTLFTAGGSRVKTLDPAQADDLASRNMIGAVYDTLLQYDYTARPYRLIPSMLAELPRVNETLDVYTFRLRDDLRFADDPCFREDPGARRITARDFIYSVLRIADARNHSPVYWLFRGKIRGLDEFHRRTAVAEPGDLSVYEPFPEGFEVIDDLNFRIRLVKPDPRFSYMLAMPNAGVVSRRAVEFYGDEFARHPVGSGPFRLTLWINDYKLQLDRNPDYRIQYFSEAENPAGRATCEIKVVAVEPASSPMIEKGYSGSHKIQGIGANFIPANFDRKVCDFVMGITDEQAMDGARLIAKKEGILVGISSGAALYAAMELAKKEENQGKNIVVIIPDTGDRYLSTELFS